jgi:2-polyprenyl-6-methoxyphenol hydroxylase-like FAD-dependent oxidoreductase
MNAPVLRASVLVVGAGVAGSVLALELARHHVPSIVVERASRPPSHPDLNLIRSRGMELLRRLGLTKELRRHGLGPDCPADVIWSPRLDQPPVLVSQIPSANQLRVRHAATHHGSSLVEPYLLVPGGQLAGRLRDAARAHPLVDLREGWTFTGMRRERDSTVATVLEAGAGIRHAIKADHLAGCDGAQSTVRRCLGIPMEHLSSPAPHYTVQFRCADLIDRFERPSTIITDGLILAWHGARDFWIGHLSLSAEEAAVPDPAQLLQDRLGVGPDAVEILAVAQGDTALGVAGTYRRGSAYLAGESAHRFDPIDGNADTCIGDAVDLGWKLAASINGWGGTVLLSSYASERRRHALLERELLARSQEARRRFSRLTAAGASREFLADVLRQEPPQLETTETGPEGGCASSPFIRQAGGVHLSDLLGPQFTLLDLTDDRSGLPMLAAARARGIPMTHLPVRDAATRACWGSRLALVRPDQHIAWHGVEPPSDWDGVLDVVTGHRSEHHVNT